MAEECGWSTAGGNGGGQQEQHPHQQHQLQGEPCHLLRNHWQNRNKNQNKWRDFSYFLRKKKEKNATSTVL